MITIETYLTYAEFNRGIAATREQFSSELSQYNRDEIVRFCILSNNAIYGLGPDFNKEAHEEILRSACPPQMVPLEFAKRRSRPVFHRQQLLFVAKQALLTCSPNGRPLRPGPSLLVLFLMASDQGLGIDLSERPLAKKEILPLLARFIPVVESNRFFPFQHKFTRPLIMLNKVVPMLGADLPFNLKRLFADATGVEPEEYFGLIFASLSACSQFSTASLMQNPESLAIDSKFLSESTFTPQQIQRFLNDVSADADEYRTTIAALDRGSFDFTCFKDKPMLRVGTRHYPTDLHLLGARCESALYWKCLSQLSGKDQERFRSFWGRLFQKYINWVLGRFANSKLNRFVADPMFDRTIEEVCDGLILSGTSLVMCECKGGLFAANAKYEGEIEKLRTDLEKKFIGTPENRKGASQLANSIELLFSQQKKRITDVDISEVRKVYPVLIVHDDIAGAWLMNTYLKERFKELSAEKFRRLSNSRGFKVTVTPLFCISADHLEIVAEALVDTRMTEILDARYRADKDLRLAFLTPDNSALGERSKRLPRFMSDEMREFTDRLRTKFLSSP